MLPAHAYSSLTSFGSLQQAAQRGGSLGSPPVVGPNGVKLKRRPLHRLALRVGHPQASDFSPPIYGDCAAPVTQLLQLCDSQSQAFDLGSQFRLKSECHVLTYRAVVLSPKPVQHGFDMVCHEFHISLSVV